jgi:protein FRA10AC1
MSTREELTGSHFDKSDLEALKEEHQFVRDDEHDETNQHDWKVRMARKYYDKLYKEYAIVDLSRYGEGLVGLRWQTEAEVLSGKGQLTCGARKCSSTSEQDLTTYELPFSYIEHGESKMELVKVCLCDTCSKKLKVYQKKQRQNENIASQDDSSNNQHKHKRQRHKKDKKEKEK